MFPGLSSSSSAARVAVIGSVAPHRLEQRHAQRVRECAHGSRVGDQLGGRRLGPASRFGALIAAHPPSGDSCRREA